MILIPASDPATSHDLGLEYRIERDQAGFSPFLGALIYQDSLNIQRRARLRLSNGRCLIVALFNIQFASGSLNTRFHNLVFYFIIL